MDKSSNKFVVAFQAIVCVVLALLLASAYNGFKSSIRDNQRFDKQRNILKAVGLWNPATDGGKTREELESLFDERMRGVILEVKREVVAEKSKRAGKVVTEQVERVQDVVKTDLEIAKLDDILREERKKPEAEQRELVPFWVRLDEQGKDEAYCIPVSGYGLWSTLYGFLALESDCEHVAGITFYQHAETPGLGGEVDNPNWQAQWVGKSVRTDSGQLIGIEVQKGRAPPGAEHAVDGLSGATITGNGVERFVQSDLVTYEPYFQKLLKR